MNKQQILLVLFYSSLYRLGNMSTFLQTLSERTNHLFDQKLEQQLSFTAISKYSQMSAHSEDNLTIS